MIKTRKFKLYKRKLLTMNTKLIFFIITLFLIFSPSSVKAEEIQIIAPEIPIIIYAGRTNELQIPIKNEGKTRDIFYFSVWPSQWISLEKSWVSLDSEESGNISLIITPPIDVEEGTRIFTVTARSLSTKVSDSKDVYLNVKRKVDIFISEIKLNKQILRPDETLTIQPVITNIDKTQSYEIYLTTKILKDNLLIKKFDETISMEPSSIKTLTQLLPVKITHAHGDYDIVVTIRDSLNEFLDEEKSSFKIERVYDVVEQKTVEYGLFYSMVRVDVTNRGNVFQSNFSVEESIPIILGYFFYPEVEPVSEIRKDNRIVYTWRIESLDPDETRTIGYQLRFFNIILGTIIVTILVIVSFYLFLKPTLVKKYAELFVGEKENIVSLYIKNRGRKAIKNIVIKDFVPALARVVRKFDTLVPEINRKDIGTELTWKIDKLKPREERILTYRIKPIIEVLGELKLPKAYFTYETKKGKKKKVVSKTFILKTKVK